MERRGKKNRKERQELCGDNLKEREERRAKNDDLSSRTLEITLLGNRPKKREIINDECQREQTDAIYKSTNRAGIL